MKKYEINSGEIDAKRFRLPVIHKQNCPICGESAERNLEEHYLMYPDLGEFEFDMYCDECGHEWGLKAKLTIILEIEK